MKNSYYCVYLIKNSAHCVYLMKILVQAALDRAKAGRTTIVVAHRLSTVRSADKIVAIKATVGDYWSTIIVVFPLYSSSLKPPHHFGGPNR